jgi:hypothetical protein
MLTRIGRSIGFDDEDVDDDGDDSVMIGLPAVR